MLHSYAVTPDCIDTSEDAGVEHPVQSVERALLNMERNGILVNYHGGEWLREINNKFRNLKDKSEQNKDIARCLDVVRTLICRFQDRNQIIVCPKIHRTEEREHLEWLTRAHDLLKDESSIDLSLILSTDLYIDEFRSVGAIDSFEDICKATRFNGGLHKRQNQDQGHIPRTEEAFCQLVDPLVRCSTKLWLIDQYLNPHLPRFFNTVETCSELLSKSIGNQRSEYSSNKIINIHVGKKSLKWRDGNKDKKEEDADQRKAVWRKKLQPLANKFKHTYKITLWGKWDDRAKQHDRYFVTDRLGLSIGAGLDFTPEDESPTFWQTLSWDSKNTLVNEWFDDGLPLYGCLGPPVVVTPELLS